MSDEKLAGYIVKTNTLGPGRYWAVVWDGAPLHSGYGDKTPLDYPFTHATDAFPCLTRWGARHSLRRYLRRHPTTSTLIETVEP